MQVINIHNRKITTISDHDKTHWMYADVSGYETYREVGNAIMSGSLTFDAAVYVGDGVWIRPDGYMMDEDDPNEEWTYDHED